MSDQMLLMGYAIEVRGPRQRRGYIMDNRVFDNLSEARKYLKSQGSAEWSKDWHIIRIYKESP